MRVMSHGLGPWFCLRVKKAKLWIQTLMHMENMATLLVPLKRNENIANWTNWTTTWQMMTAKI